MSQRRMSGADLPRPRSRRSDRPGATRTRDEWEAARAELAATTTQAAAEAAVANPCFVLGAAPLAIRSARADSWRETRTRVEQCSARLPTGSSGCTTTTTTGSRRRPSKTSTSLRRTTTRAIEVRSQGIYIYEK